MSKTERPYLVCYDYGMGGLWWWITAPSPQEITNTYENVIVFEEPPEWWTDKNDRYAQRLQLGESPPAP